MDKENKHEEISDLPSINNSTNKVELDQVFGDLGSNIDCLSTLSFDELPLSFPQKIHIHDQISSQPSPVTPTKPREEAPKEKQSKPKAIKKTQLFREARQESRHVKTASLTNSTQAILDRVFNRENPSWRRSSQEVYGMSLTDQFRYKDYHQTEKEELLRGVKWLLLDSNQSRLVSNELGKIHSANLKVPGSKPHEYFLNSGNPEKEQRNVSPMRILRKDFCLGVPLGQGDSNQPFKTKYCQDVGSPSQKVSEKLQKEKDPLLIHQRTSLAGEVSPEKYYSLRGSYENFESQTKTRNPSFFQTEPREFGPNEPKIKSKAISELFGTKLPTTMENRRSFNETSRPELKVLEYDCFAHLKTKKEENLGSFEKVATHKSILDRVFAKGISGSRLSSHLSQANVQKGIKTPMTFDILNPRSPVHNTPYTTKARLVETPTESKEAFVGFASPQKTGVSSRIDKIVQKSLKKSREALSGSQLSRRQDLI